jgi:hypothetical protein
VREQQREKSAMNKTRTVKATVLGTLFTSTLTYAAALGVMAGFSEAQARDLPSSICHPELDNVGSTLTNSGYMTYTGTTSMAIYCPAVSDSALLISENVRMDVYGVESTDGASSRACECDVSPLACSCSPGTNWSNNAGGVGGKVAANVDTSTWDNNRATEFAYMKHTLKPNSSLVAMNLWLP